MAGFLNASGGTLIVGLRDDKRVLGLKNDYALCGGSADGLELKIRDVIRSRFMQAPFGLIDVRVEVMYQSHLLRIDVEPLAAPEVCQLKGFDDRAQGGDCDTGGIYIRHGNRTLKLEGVELGHWMQRRVNGAR